MSRTPCILMTLLVTCGFTSLAAAASVEEALKYVPVQQEVEYDRPSANEIAKCTIKSEQVGKFAACVVYGAAGQKLRVFADTNNDNNVDRWSYYLNGIECYRDCHVTWAYGLVRCRNPGTLTGLFNALRGIGAWHSGRSARPRHPGVRRCRLYGFRRREDAGERWSFVRRL